MFLLDEEDIQQSMVSEQVTDDSVTIRGNREHRRGMRARRPWKQYNMTEVEEGDDELPPCWKVRKNKRMNATLDEPVTSSPEAEITTEPADIDQPCRPGRGHHHHRHHHRHHHHRHHHRHHNKTMIEEEEQVNPYDTEELTQTINMENRRIRNRSRWNERRANKYQSTASLNGKENDQPTTESTFANI